MEKQETKPIMMSLYNYLGHAAGSELGKKVHETAIKLKEPIKTREIDTKIYKGPVCLYRKEFLQEYFKFKQNPEVNPSLGDYQDYSL
jgi:hypothetical protein